MFDVTSHISYENVPELQSELNRVFGNIPIVMRGNKVDMQDRKVEENQIISNLKENTQYYDISAKTNINFSEPFLCLAQKLLGDDQLHFFEAPAL